MSETLTNQIIIKRSRFIVNIAFISNETEAKNFIEQIKKDNKKATHNVWAYMLGENDQVQRKNDDGEPSGTAGMPIIQLLQKRQEHNIAVVVTRYFGGVKLGAGGLIRAYAGSVKQTLDLL